MKVRVLYHDHCFDGAASAAYITRFLQAHDYPTADFAYTGLAHRADQLFEDSLFDGDANVIVDFKYATHPNLTWWFDHHQSAFLSPEDAEHFRRDTSGRKLFDPSYRSCTKFIAADASSLFASLDTQTFKPGETAVILDPPRKGCDKSFIRQLAEFGPERVCYVSCNVHTQARDVGWLVGGCGGGWRPRR